MTQEQYEEITAYFNEKKLPIEFRRPDGIINDCKTYVATNINRMQNGAALVQNTSYLALVRFREMLEEAD